MDDIQNAIYRLAQRFVERQQIVRDAIQELQPYFLASPQDMGGEAYFRLAAFTGHIASTGVWREWDYFTHGMGCRLTHRETGERIEWDAPDLQRFENYWFVNWLIWLMQAHREDEDAAVLLKYAQGSTEEWLRKFVLAQLKVIPQVTVGIIVSEEWSECTLRF
jgi:hypothetical protein